MDAAAGDGKGVDGTQDAFVGICSRQSDMWMFGIVRRRDGTEPAAGGFDLNGCFNALWGSGCSRLAHYQEIVGSNPARATSKAT